MTLCSFQFTQNPFASSIAAVVWARLYLQTNTTYTVVWEGGIFLQRHVNEHTNTMKCLVFILLAQFSPWGTGWQLCCVGAGLSAAVGVSGSTAGTAGTSDWHWCFKLHTTESNFSNFLSKARNCSCKTLSCLGLQLSDLHFLISPCLWLFLFNCLHSSFCGYEDITFLLKI